MKKKQPENVVLKGGGARLTVSLEQITPEMAERYLASNRRNRSIRTDYFKHKLAPIIKANDWVVNGQPIVFDSEGYLVDGQHRLHAVIEAGKPIWTLVVRGVEPVISQDTTDMGVRRTLGQQLTVHGEANATVLAAALVIVHRLAVVKDWIGGTRYLLMVTDGLRLLDEHPNLRESTTIGGRANRSPVRYNPGAAAALHYLFGTIDSEDSDAFWSSLMDGADLVEGSPILALRAALLKDITRPVSSGKMTAKYKTAITVKAWNLWRQGDACQRLVWRPGGSNKEPFPQYDEEQQP